MSTPPLDSILNARDGNLPKEKRFFEGSIRHLVGSQDELEIASERLGHASTATTKKFYRSNVTNVAPLIPQRNSKKS